MKIILVIDGMGGGIGAAIISSLVKNIGENAQIICVGTNASATEKMLKAGASRGATGENAIRVNASQADIICGPIGIVMPNSLMGELTPNMADYITLSKAKKALISVSHPNTHIAGLEEKPLAELVSDAVGTVKKFI